MKGIGMLLLVIAALIVLFAFTVQSEQNRVTCESFPGFRYATTSFDPVLQEWTVLCQRGAYDVVPLWYLEQQSLMD